MRKFFILGLFAVNFLGMLYEARAEFLISSAILEFTKEGPKQQDIELISRSADNDYIETDITEIIQPGTDHESRRVITDPADSWLLVTPDKSILTGNSRKLLRFVLLKEPDASEHIFRISVKPVIKGIESTTKVGIKVLVGYEVLVIIRPTLLQPAYSASRQGKALTIRNTGNTNILFQNGTQCPPPENCPLAPGTRVYAQTNATLTLPTNKPVTYSVWDGRDNVQKSY